MIFFTSSHFLRRIVGCIAVFFLVCEPAIARADLFLFRDGRVVSGKVTDEIQGEVGGLKVTQYTVQTRNGVFVQILSSELQLHGKKGLTDLELEYAAKFREQPPTTAEEHFVLAGWCRSKLLGDLANAHYEAALDLDPNHSPARQAAGYEELDGRWVKEEIVMGEMRGKVLRGRVWIFPEEAAIIEEREQADAAMAEVKKKWTVLNNQAAFVRTLGPEIRQKAIANIRAIQDPRAVGIFSDHLLSTRRQAPTNVRLAYVDLLSKFPQAAPTLARASVTDPDVAVRNSCLNALRGADPGSVVPVFLSFFGGADNARINRAAEGIAQFPTQDAIIPLIQNLVTTHEFANNGAEMNASPSNGSFSMGGPKKVKRDLQNQSVLGALTSITNQNYEYNENAWIDWYARTYAKPARDLRRDP